MTWLSTDWKKLNDEFVKAGFIVSAQVYAARPRNPREADLMLCITYKNMATLDNLEERTEEISEKFMGTRQKANAAAIGRESMREVLGSEVGPGRATRPPALIGHVNSHPCLLWDRYR